MGEGRWLLFFFFFVKLTTHVCCSVGVCYIDEKTDRRESVYCISSFQATYNFGRWGASPATLLFPSDVAAVMAVFFDLTVRASLFLALFGLLCLECEVI